MRALAAQADNSVTRVEAILALYQRLKKRMAAVTGSRYSLSLLDAIFAQPVFKASTLHKLSAMPQRPQMMKLLEQMVEARILKVLVLGSGRRATVYYLHELVRVRDNKLVPSRIYVR